MFSFRFHDTLDSTNNEAKRCIPSKENLIIWAKEQTNGRGRHDRTWVSKSGNLFVSILLKRDFDITIASQLSFVTAIAVRCQISDIRYQNEKKKITPACGVHSCGRGRCQKISFKWPNDILINGKKAGGILLEAVGDYMIVGIGINVKSYPDNVMFPATSLNNEGINVDVEDLLHNLTDTFFHWLDVWKNDGFSVIREKWLANAAGIGEKIKIDGKTGVFEGIAENGELILSGDKIIAGDLCFL